MGKKKKEELDKMYAEFESGMKANGYSDGAVKALWDTLLPFADYAFNRAHSAAYGVISYWTAYLKANYTAEFMAALLTSVGGSKDKLSIYLSECRKLGIKVLPPDVNESVGHFAAIGEDIRFGLGAIRNVGHNVVDAIVSHRENKYKSFNDFLKKVPLVVCNKKTIDSLVKAGGFDSLMHTRRSLSEIHEQAVDAQVSTKRKEAQGQVDLGLDGQFHLVRELVAIGGEELDPVVLVGVVGGGDDDPGHGAEGAGQIGNPRRWHGPEQAHIQPGGHQARLQGRLKHVARDASILANQYLATAPPAQDVPRGPAKFEYEVRANPSLAHSPTDTVGAEIPARHAVPPKEIDLGVVELAPSPRWTGKAAPGFASNGGLCVRARSKPKSASAVSHLEGMRASLSAASALALVDETLACPGPLQQRHWP
jgi:hypothetical protein